jgi:hypothetical protein
MSQTERGTVIKCNVESGIGSWNRKQDIKGNTGDI